MTSNAVSPRTIALIGIPSSAGARKVGQEQAPEVLRAAGLLAQLRSHGLEVHDRGNLPQAVYRPDPDHPRRQNLGLVRRVASQVADEVELAITAGHFPVVLGGDCTVSIGVLAGLLRRGPRVGLFYLDADLDLNTPETTPSGVFDGMVTAHLLGQGAPELARLGPCFPLVEEAHLAYFGYDAGAGGIDPWELAALGRSAALRFPIEAVRRDPLAAAQQALAQLEGRVERILTHFDVDVTDTVAVDVPHGNGLPIDRAAEVIQLCTSSPKCIGLVVTEYNPELDPGHALAAPLATHLASALGTATPAASRDRRAQAQTRA